MKKFIILVFLFLLSGCTNVNKIYDTIDEIETREYTTSKNQYYINAKFDSSNNSLVVKQRIIYNPEVNLGEIYLNVYGNALSEEEPMVKINSLKLDNKDVVWNWSGDKYSNIYINLDDEVNVNDEISIDIEYTLSLSEEGKRFAIKKLSTTDEYFNIIAMFFYPVVAMYDEDGWHLEEHSFQGEVYYNTISDYYVNLELPSYYKLATGGVIKSKKELDETTKYEIELINGRDYSFSASANYIEYSKLINDVDVKIVSLLELSQNEIDEIFDITEKALNFGEEVLGPYIYDNLTIELGHIYGMESSSIIYNSVEEINYKTIVHEIYHQWLYSIIGSNQGDESWLDEGLTTFITGEFTKRYPDVLGIDYYSIYDINQEKYIEFQKRYEGETVLKNILDFKQDNAEYAILVYYYGATILNYYLEELLNSDEELLYKAFRRYYDEYSLGIASIDDFLTILEEETGLNYTKEWIMGYLNEFQLIKDESLNIDDYISNRNPFSYIDDIELKDTLSNKNQYYINGKLDTKNSLLTVKQKIVYYTNDNLNELFLNIYPNALSTVYPFVKIQSIKLDGADAVWDWNDETYQSIYVELNENLNKGDRVELDIEYILPYSEDGIRFAKKNVNQNDPDYISMFFYPVVTMHDEEGWHTDQHSFQGEVYYNSISDYYVNLELPSNYVLATGGKVVNALELNDTTKYEIELIDGRDYSFSASTNYVEYNKTINDIDVQIKSLKTLTDEEVSKIFEVTEESVNFAEDILGPYIYDTLTIELGYIYGMESSSIVYCASNISYTTIVHEIYHQWFYSMIGNNQGDESWLDEGLTTYLTGEFIINHPELINKDYYASYDMNQEKYEKFHTDLDGKSVLRNIHEFNQTSEYAVLVYYYGTTILHYYVENLLDSNEELMYKALEKYYDEYNGDIASVDEFLTVLETETGVDNTKEWFMKYLNEFQIVE